MEIAMGKQPRRMGNISPNLGSRKLIYQTLEMVGHLLGKYQTKCNSCERGQEKTSSNQF